MGAYDGTILYDLISQSDNTPALSTNVDIESTIPVTPQGFLKEEIGGWNFPYPKAVGFIDKDLMKFQDKNQITEMQRDALRHYYGTRELARQFGPNIARLMGRINEPFDLALSGKEQSEIDLSNNEMALRHFQNNIGRDYHVLTDINEVHTLLDSLIIPPKPKWMQGQEFSGMQSSSQVDPYQQ